MDEKLKQAIALELAKHPNVRCAIMFGSAARGTDRQGSDVDLAIEGSDMDTLQLAANLSLSTGREFDVVDLRDAGYPMLQAIVREGKAVYESRAGQAAQWRSHAIATLETDRVWYTRMREGFLQRLAHQEE